MKQHDEQLMFKLIEYTKRDQCDLFDAIITFCDDYEEDVEDIVKALSKNSIERIKNAAIDARRVRRFYAKPVNTLCFE